MALNFYHKIIKYKTGVINDPLGQTHSLVSSDHCFLFFCFAKKVRTDGRTTCAKIMIPTGCGLAEWIKIFQEKSCKTKVR